MSNKRKCSIIDLLPIILTIVLTVSVFVFAILMYNPTPITAIILCVVGLVLNYIAGILIHELGHIVKAKKYKMQIIYVNLGILSADFITKTVKPFTFFKKDAGEARFLPTQPITEKQLKSVALNGLIFSLVFLLIGVALGVTLSIVTADPAAFCIFTAGQTTNFYILAVNALSEDKSADGNIAFSSSSFAAVLAAVSNTELDISKGLIPAEPELIKHDNQPIALYYHYLFTALSGGKDAAFGVLTDIDLDSLTDQEYALIFPELLFKACKQKTVSEEYLSLAENFFATEPNGVSVLRAHIALRTYLGDEKWAETLKGSYRKLLAEEKPFVVSVENALN